ncbi:Heat shock 70 kDa protein 12A [Lachnellula cervina]|uniref:Heat shock 70 kDa protein 12A n=1 Tax=Lachnellula cervina TaxID=1316786 RepID=A0A7D8YQR8_9HELO|nr:Heat shock 70 kDa protein 12A [Lachnellula cervina]
MAPKEPKEPMRLLVAVDFGTTFSGVAYLQTLNDWGEAGGEGEKVPTTLKYDLGQFSPPRFGFNIDGDEDGKIEWFKLGLYPNVEETSLAKKYPIKTPKMSDSECKRHVVNYLTALREHTDTYLKDRFGDAFWRSTPREYIITVPAIWQDKSKDTTLVCAEKAGMGPRNKIQVVAEPEAAGIYALQSMENIDLKVNDTFVICDAGGGTIDLVSYTVNSLKPIPVIGEVVVGSGALCGGTFLDRIFAEYLTNKFHDYGPWDDEYQAAALKVFEKDIKRKFAGDTSRTYTIRVRQLPDNSALGIRRGFLEIPGKDIKRVFEPVVREILKRVKLQIQATESKAKKVKAVLLAGGFGRNEYLRSRLKDELGVNVDVRKVENSNTSIVRGALIYGLAKKVPRLATFLVDTNIARRNYG